MDYISAAMHVGGPVVGYLSARFLHRKKLKAKAAATVCDAVRNVCNMLEDPGAEWLAVTEDVVQLKRHYQLPRVTVLATENRYGIKVQITSHPLDLNPTEMRAVYNSVQLCRQHMLNRALGALPSVAELQSYLEE